MGRVSFGPGLYCKACYQRRPWDKVDARYERQGTDIIRIWFCDRCGNMLREDNLEEIAPIERSE